MNDKKDLYIDCDGVIIDTITTIIMELNKLGYDYQQVKKDNKFMTHYLSHKFLFSQKFPDIPAIDDNINKIIQINKTNIFNSLAILTHVITPEEAKIKIKRFNDELPGIKVITVPKQLSKSSFVPVKNAILVDDYPQNTLDWYTNGGIGINYKEPSPNENILTINDLLELITIFSPKQNSRKKRVLK